MNTFKWEDNFDECYSNAIKSFMFAVNIESI